MQVDSARRRLLALALWLTSAAVFSQRKLFAAEEKDLDECLSNKNLDGWKLFAAHDHGKMWATLKPLKMHVECFPGFTADFRFDIDIRATKQLEQFDRDWDEFKKGNGGQFDNEAFVSLYKKVPYSQWTLAVSAWLSSVSYHTVELDKAKEKFGSWTIRVVDGEGADFDRHVLQKEGAGTPTIRLEDKAADPAEFFVSGPESEPDAKEFLWRAHQTGSVVFEVSNPNFGVIKAHLDTSNLKAAMLASIDELRLLDERFNQKNCDWGESACFVTTSCCGLIGLEDDCFELRSLRWFRDRILPSLDGGNRDIATYYRVAPRICSILMRRHPEKLLEVYWRYIVPCVGLVTLGFYESARARYSLMMRELLELCDGRD